MTSFWKNLLFSQTWKVKASNIKKTRRIKKPILINENKVKKKRSTQTEVEWIKCLGTVKGARSIQIVEFQVTRETTMVHNEIGLSQSYYKLIVRKWKKTNVFLMWEDQKSCIKWDVQQSRLLFTKKTKSLHKNKQNTFVKHKNMYNCWTYVKLLLQWTYTIWNKTTKNACQGLLLLKMCVHFRVLVNAK